MQCNVMVVWWGRLQWQLQNLLLGWITGGSILRAPMAIYLKPSRKQSSLLLLITQKSFKLVRDDIAQTLFSCKLITCSGCDNVELGFPEDDEYEDLNVGNHQINNYDYGVAEALTDEIEEESHMFGEVVKLYASEKELWKKLPFIEEV
ncbi:hypothetical protein L1887_11456 [Cichorium endivia]|nr:hypothetical protein L1887_11456 [Cichorium endivia]